MAKTKVVLQGDVAERLQRLVAEEKYSAAEEAVAAALDALEATDDPQLDAWLRGTILSRSEAIAADPSRAVTSKDIRARLLGR